MNITQLEQLIEIAKRKTLSAAAESLHISQPALSRSMQKLENDLGTTLFDRTKNSIQLNETGEVAVKYAETVLNTVSNMRNSIIEFEKKKRTISVCSCAPAPLWRLLPLLSTAYPASTISSEIKNITQVLNGIKESQYQIAILPQAIDDNEFLSFKLCEEHLFFSVPPAHPLAAYPGVYLHDLNGETTLLMSNIGFWHELTHEKMPDSYFIVQDKAYDHKELVRLSSLPSFVTDLAMEHEKSVSNRIQIPILDQEANPQFYCIIHRNQKKQFAALLDKLCD